MNQQIQPYQIIPVQTVQPLAPITPQAIQAIMGVIGVIWMGAFVLQQVIKVAKGEEIEKPPPIVS